MDETARPDLLCKDCKHSFITVNRIFYAVFRGFLKPPSYLYKCSRVTTKEKIEEDFVSGPVIRKQDRMSCTLARMPASYRDEDLCEPEAKYWTPKHKKHLFLALTK